MAWLKEWKNLFAEEGGCAGPSFFCFGGPLELSGSPDTEVLKLLAQSICPGWAISGVAGPSKALWGRSIGVSIGQMCDGHGLGLQKRV